MPDPLLEPRDRVLVAEHALGLGDDRRCGCGIQPLAGREVAVRVDRGRRVDGSRDHERLVGREAVVDHRRDVDDRDIGRGQLPAELADRRRRRAGRRGSAAFAAAIAAMMRRFAAPYSGFDDAGARVRAIDHAMRAGREQRRDERLAVADDRAVVGGRPIALPRRRVEDDGPLVRACTAALPE